MLNILFICFLLAQGIGATHGEEDSHEKHDRMLECSKESSAEEADFFPICERLLVSLHNLETQDINQILDHKRRRKRQTDDIFGGLFSLLGMGDQENHTGNGSKERSSKTEPKNTRNSDDQGLNWFFDILGIPNTTHSPSEEPSNNTNTNSSWIWNKWNPWNLTWDINNSTIFNTSRGHKWFLNFLGLGNVTLENKNDIGHSNNMDWLLKLFGITPKDTRNDTDKWDLEETNFGNMSKRLMQLFGISNWTWTNGETGITDTKDTDWNWLWNLLKTTNGTWTFENVTDSNFTDLWTQSNSSAQDRAWILRVLGLDGSDADEGRGKSSNENSSSAGLEWLLNLLGISGSQDPNANWNSTMQQMILDLFGVSNSTLWNGTDKMNEDHLRNKTSMAGLHWFLNILGINSSIHEEDRGLNHENSLKEKILELFGMANNTSWTNNGTNSSDSDSNSVFTRLIDLLSGEGDQSPWKRFENLIENGSDEVQDIKKSTPGGQSKPSTILGGNSNPSTAGTTLETTHTIKSDKPSDTTSSSKLTTVSTSTSTHNSMMTTKPTATTRSSKGNIKTTTTISPTTTSKTTTFEETVMTTTDQNAVYQNLLDQLVKFDPNHPKTGKEELELRKKVCRHLLSFNGVKSKCCAILAQICPEDVAMGESSRNSEEETENDSDKKIGAESNHILSVVSSSLLKVTTLFQDMFSFVTKHHHHNGDNMDNAHN